MISEFFLCKKKISSMDCIVCYTHTESVNTHCQDNRHALCDDCFKKTFVCPFRCQASKCFSCHSHVADVAHRHCQQINHVLCAECCALGRRCLCLTGPPFRELEILEILSDQDEDDSDCEYTSNDEEEIFGYEDESQ